MNGADIVFKRKIYDGLLKWKNESNGTSALMIEGARRIGKSTIVEEFAKNEYSSYLLLDFNNIDEITRTIFDNGIGNDIDSFFSKLQLSENVTLHIRKSVIIFDEVQSYPKARQMIKYLVKDGRYDYIETGSLISLKKNIEMITLPSEEETIRMHPMDFEEFLWALGDETTIPFIRKAFEKREPVSDPIHRKILNRYREYMAVGGMPQVVSQYVRTKDFNTIDREKKLIWTLYNNDVEKIPQPNDTKVSAILKTVPFLLGKKNKKFSPNAVKKDSRMDDFDNPLEWLDQSHIINICKNVTDPSPIMELDVDAHSIKCYILDTGLLVFKATDGNKTDLNELYKSFIFGKLSVNEGMFFENMVAQELTASGHELRMHLFTIPESTKNYEIDFLLKKGKKIIPVEVKSGKSSTHASLDRFMSKYKGRYDECFVIHTKDLRKEGKVTYIPIYMTMFL